MTIKIKIRGMALAYNGSNTRKYKPLAYAEVFIPALDLTIRGVGLAWSPERGFVALAPITNKSAPTVQWYQTGEFARALTKEMLLMFERMGGEMPEEKPKRQFVPMHELNISQDEGVPLHRRIEDALDDESDRRGVPCFTQAWERTEPDADDHEAVEGLARTLSVEHQEAARVLG